MRYDTPAAHAAIHRHPEVVAQLQRQRERLDPFALAHTIELLLERRLLLPVASPRGRCP